MKDVIGKYQDYMISNGAARNTIRLKISLLRLMEETHGDIRFLSQDAIIECISQKGLKKSTLFCKYTYLEGFFKWLELNNEILFNPMSKISKPRVEKRLPTRVMTVGETKKILAVYDTDPANPIQFMRRTMLELMYSCSLRRMEVVNLNLDDFEPINNSIRILNSKGNKGRVVPVGKFASEMLETYINEVRRPSSIRAIFINTFGQRFNPHYLTIITSEARKVSKIRTKASSHSFRKSSATAMLKNGASLTSVQAILGHSAIESTQVYTKINNTDVFKAFASYHPRMQQKNAKAPEFVMPKYLSEGKFF